MRKRKYSLHVMLDEAEWHKLCQLEENSGLDRSRVIRKLILEEPVRQRPDRDFRSFRRSIDYIGNNINMICHHANVCRLIDNEDLRQVREYMSEIRSILRGMENTYDSNK